MDDVYPERLPYDFHPGHMRQISLASTILVKSRRWSMSEYPYPVTLDWSRRPEMERWNEICAWTMEHFGLPGIKYVTEISAERMTWYFENEQDKLLFTIAWGNDNYGI